MSSPEHLYQRLILKGDCQPDPQQALVVKRLQSLYTHLRSSPAPQETRQGLYLWGPVGRGKTMLMGLMAQSLGDGCLRQHFHHFMRDVHQKLTALQGTQDPLMAIADDFASRYQVLCFDEFFVSDIGDAMLLGTLLCLLFERGVTLVATSNTPVERLYWNGLQRQRFLPAIAALQQHTQSLCVDNGLDYRCQMSRDICNYFVTQTWDIGETLKAALIHRDVWPLVQKEASLMVLGRHIGCLARTRHTVVFSFSQVCEGPRSTLDYIALAQTYREVFILDIPPLSGECREGIKARGTEDGAGSATLTGNRQIQLAPKDDATRRLIALVDECYERGVRVYLGCEVPLEHLYTRGSLTFEFERLMSRVREMASNSFLTFD